MTAEERRSAYLSELGRPSDPIRTRPRRRLSVRDRVRQNLDRKPILPLANTSGMCEHATCYTFTLDGHCIDFTWVLAWRCDSHERTIRGEVVHTFSWQEYVKAYTNAQKQLDERRIDAKLS